MTEQAPVQALLLALEGAGARLGVDDLLRVGRVLSLRQRWTRDDLRLALRPVLARDVEGVARFDAVFEQVYAHGSTRLPDEPRAAAPSRPPDGPQSVEPPRPSVLPRSGRRRRVAAGVAVAAAMGATALLVETSPGPGDVVVVPTPTNANAPPPGPAVARDRPPRAAPPGSAAAREASLAVMTASLVTAVGIGVLRRLRRRRPLHGPWHYRPTVPMKWRPPVHARARVEALADQLAAIAPRTDHHELDVLRSVEATVRAGRVPHLIHAQRAVAAEYAVVYDADAARAPWRPFLAELFARLARAGIVVTEHEFLLQPNRCRPLGGREEATLAQIAERAVRVFLIGEAERVILRNPRTSPSWFADLTTLDNVVWLEPTPREDWSDDLVSLAEVIPVAPSTTTGLQAVLAGVSERTQTRARAAAGADTDNVLREARERLGPVGFRSLQAGAMVDQPILDVWRWIAAEVGLVLDEDTQLRLAKLPWLRREGWPAGMARALARSLRSEAPQMFRRAHEAASKLLEEVRPPAGSGAELQWRVERASTRARVDARAAARELDALVDSPIGRAARDHAARLGLRNLVGPAQWAQGALAGAATIAACVYLANALRQGAPFDANLSALRAAPAAIDAGPGPDASPSVDVPLSNAAEGRDLPKPLPEKPRRRSRSIAGADGSQRGGALMPPQSAAAFDAIGGETVSQPPAPPPPPPVSPSDGVAAAIRADLPAPPPTPSGPAGGIDDTQAASALRSDLSHFIESCQDVGRASFEGDFVLRPGSLRVSVRVTAFQEVETEQEQAAVQRCIGEWERAFSLTPEQHAALSRRTSLHFRVRR